MVAVVSHVIQPTTMLLMTGFDFLRATAHAFPTNEIRTKSIMFKNGADRKFNQVNVK